MSAAGAAFFDLLHGLGSRKGKVTPEETNLLITCQSEAKRAFMVGTISGGLVTWAVTSRLKKAQLYLSGVAAACYGLARFQKSLDSSVDRILHLEGSQIQRDLANIVVNKYQDDPLLMKLMSRHFYSEKVFDDSSADKPKLRWRYRNFSGANLAPDQSTNDSESQTESDTVSHNDSGSEMANTESKQVPSSSITTKANVESKQVYKNPSAADMSEDPLDGIFGHMAPMEQIHHPSTSTAPDKTHARNHRRSRRKHRILRREAHRLNQVQPQRI